LGNVDHILPKGVVCDTCNNYFARKIEKPLLESEYFRQLRSFQGIPNKRKKIPTTPVIIPSAGLATEAWVHGGNITLLFDNPDDEHKLTKSIISGRTKTYYFPLLQWHDKKALSRFLAKVALEVLAHRLIKVEGWEKELIENDQLESIRRFARVGDKPSIWEYSERRLYDANASVAADNSYHQVLHEFDLLYTESNNLFLILCIFGIEYAIDFTSPNIEDYKKWLIKNHYKSPLYINEPIPQ
jgi:hypothetical protein